MILGEIVIDKKYNTNPLISQLSNNQILNIKDDYTYNEVPTLYIGWKNVSEIFKTNVSILDKKIKKNIFWTFSPEENLQDFNEDTIIFIDKLYDDFIKNIKYTFICPVIKKFKKLEDILKNLITDKFNSTYITDNFIYCYYDNSKTIFGIDIEYYKFLKFDIKKLINIITENSVSVVYEDYTIETGIYQKYKNLLNKNFDKKFIPYILFKNI